MEIDINQILAAYDQQVATLTRRAILAEAQVAALQQLAQQPAPTFEQPPAPEAVADLPTEGR